MQTTKAFKVLRLARRHGVDRELTCKLLAIASREVREGDAGCEAAIAVISKAAEMSPEVYSAALSAARRKSAARRSGSTARGRRS